MDKEFSECSHPAEEDYIDMDLTSTTYLCCHTSTPNNTEFEFNLASNLSHIPTYFSSADELFYNGKLLPLHPPRHMVESQLPNSEIDSLEKLVSTATDTESSSYMSSYELNPEAYFQSLSVKSDKKKSWPIRLKGLRKSFLKLKATKTCFKSLFAKPRLSEELNMADQEEESDAFVHIQGRKNSDREEVAYDCCQRKSLSSVHMSSVSSQSSLCSTSSSSFSSKSRFPPKLKKSTSVNAEMENSVLGAITYCKMSQQVSARKSASDISCCSLTCAKITASCDSLERPQIC